jgi:hypothetical protein
VSAIQIIIAKINAQILKAFEPSSGSSKMLAAMLRIEKASISQFLYRWIKRKWIKLALNIGN